MNKYGKIANLSVSSVYNKYYLIILLDYVSLLSYKQKNSMIQIIPQYDMYSAFNCVYIIQKLKILSLFCLNCLNSFTASHFPHLFYDINLHFIVHNLLIKNIIVLQFVTKKDRFFFFSFSNIYLGCNWLEREMFDMFGLFFINHKNLRRILTDYGFKGFPLLKQFPVFGYKELRYDTEKRNLLYTNVRLAQMWRFYYFGKQWQVN